MENVLSKKKSLTIKELYKWAIERDLENAELYFYNASMLRYYPLSFIDPTPDGKEVYVS